MSHQKLLFYIFFFIKKAGWGTVKPSLNNHFPLKKYKNLKADEITDIG
jgi:hypothetical protein